MCLPDAGVPARVREACLCPDAPGLLCSEGAPWVDTDV